MDVSVLSPELQASLGLVDADGRPLTGNSTAAGGSQSRKKGGGKRAAKPFVQSKSAAKKEAEKKRKRVERMKGDVGRQQEARECMDRIAAASLGEAASQLASSRQLVRRDRRQHKREKTLESKPASAPAPDASGKEKEDDDDDDDVEDGELLAPPGKAVHADYDSDAAGVDENEIVVPVVAPLPPAREPRLDPQLTPVASLPRPADVAVARMELPVQQHEADVMGCLSTNDVVFVVAPTGSGKTTQLPQWLLEYGYRDRGMIAVTQPRKLACRMVSSRIAFETGLPWGTEVGYHTRHDKHYEHWDTCRIVLCTDGLLLAAARTDQLLQRYSVVVVDEAHERTLHTDVLLGLLSRVVVLRRQRWEAGGSIPPLKVVIMSATLDVDPLTALFRPEPRVCKLEGRQYPVTIHHALRTPADATAALEACVAAVRKVVTSLPRGCVLVFVPGKREIALVINKLQDALSNVQDRVDLLPLYAGQSQAAQQLPFDPVADGGWKVVVATNVAECALTIPDVRYVVDSGYTRSQLHDGVFVTEPCSQASANQRAGRAGRTREGHCYRMYSSAFYVHHMDEHDVPQALRVPSEELLMQLLALGVSRPATFPLPSAPPSSTLSEAAARLHALGLLTSARMPLRLTVMGSRAMALPVSPAQARLLLTADNVRLACLICGVWTAQQLQPNDRRELLASNDAPETRQQAWWRRAQAQCDVLSVVAEIEAGQSVPSPAHASARVLAEQVMTLLKADRDEPLPTALVPTLQCMLGASPWLLCRRDGDHYISLYDNQPVYLHPTHCCRAFAQARHPWISCLSTLTLTERRYAVHPFMVQPQWLLHVLPGASLVDYSRIDEKTALFDEVQGCVTVACSPRFGPLLGVLPMQRVIYRNGAVFAQLLLAGRVSPLLQPLVSSLRLDPTSLLTPPYPEACTQLLRVMERVFSLADLRAAGAAVVEAVLPFYVSAARDAARSAWTRLCQEP